MATVQWFPGHMAKTRRELKERLKLTDLVVETLDARVPLSSRNPEIARILGNKLSVAALNKSDIADPKANEAWLSRLDTEKTPCLLVDAKSGKGIAALRDFIAGVAFAKSRATQKRGVVMRPTRVMVVGIPNSGKSTIINKLANRSSAATGDRPGVTRAVKWIRVSENVELLDTPGVLWPKFDDEAVGFNLAVTGAIKDEVFDKETAAERLLLTLAETYPGIVEGRYKIVMPTRRAGDGENGGGENGDGDGDGTEKAVSIDERTPHMSVLTAICKARGFLLKGGLPDLERAAAIVLDEFREARIGRVSLELP